MKNFSKYLTVAMVLGLILPAFAETQETVRSQTMSFAKKKAAAEVSTVASTKAEEPMTFEEPMTLAETVPVLESAPVSTHTYDAVPSKTPVMIPPAPVAAVPPAASTTPAVNTSEAQTKLQAVKTQEQWVAKLTKQLEGEKNQLNEMRTGLVQAFNLDPKKLEAGKYTYDTKAGKIVEGK